MASLDPRKSESITNQANYLMTVITTVLIGVINASVQSGNWNATAYIVLAGLWSLAAGYKEVQKLVGHYTRRQIESSTIGE